VEVDETDSPKSKEASQVMTDYEQALCDNGVQKNEKSLEIGMLFDGMGGFFDGYQLNFRRTFVSRFSFAIPNDEALTIIAGQGPILEIGAGSGYWAYEIAKRGVDIISTDINPVPEGGRDEGGLHFNKSYHPVLKMSALEALAAYQNRSLLIVWPSLNESWAYEAIDAYQGSSIIYVGENEGGCCADDRFFTLLYKRFEPQKRVKIPYWECIYDEMTVFTRI